MNVKLITPELLTTIQNTFSSSKRNLFLFDYDGTLVPFNKFPSEAKPSEKVLNMLSILASDQKNEVVIISGRDRNSLEGWLGHLPIKIIAEHGAISKIKGVGWVKKENIDISWKKTIKPVLEKFVYRCTNSFIEEKETSLAWHYRNSNPEFAFIRSRELIEELQEMAAHISDIHILEGNKVIEIKSTFYNKGTATSSILLENDYDFILAAGDDRTDEDLFKALPPEAFSIKVGNEPSNARYNVTDQVSMIKCLEEIVEKQKVG